MNEEERQLGGTLADRALKLNLIGQTTHVQLRTMFEPGSPWHGVEQVFRGMEVLTETELAVVRRSNEDWEKLRRLPQFRDDLILLRELGSGGMGTVHQALDTNLNRVLAVKVVNPDALVTGAISRLLQRFEREAKILAQLDHPTIIKLFEAKITSEGSPYLLLEYVSGSTLSQVISRVCEGVPLELAVRPPLARQSGAEDLGLSGSGELDARQVAAWGRDLADGLDAVHRRGVIHRDIKPSNVLVSDKGEVKLIDFGVAFDLDGERLTKEGVAVGTALYMAPELLMGTPPTVESDVYALGVTLYEALCGEPPFYSDDARVLCAHIAKGEIPPLCGAKGRRPTLSAELGEVVQRCLAYEPGQRYASMGEVRDDLQAFLDGSLSSAREGSKPGGSLPWVGGLTILLLVGLGAVLVWVLSAT